MGRANYKYDSTDCTGGINGQDDAKLSKNQCKDALNVWAPNGVVEKRPGFVGIYPINMGWINQMDDSPILIKEDNSTVPPTYTAYTYVNGGELGNYSKLVVGGLRALAVGVPRDYWYFGYKPDSHGWFEAACDIYTGFEPDVAVINSNSTWRLPEYYSEDGCWRPLLVQGNPVTHLDEYDSFDFVPPNDWAEKTIVAGGVSYKAKWIRFGLAGQDLSANTEIRTSGLYGHQIGETINAFGVTNFSDGSRYVSLCNYYNYDFGRQFFGVDVSRNLGTGYVDEETGLGAQGAFKASKDLGVFAPVPDFDEAFLSLGQCTVRIARGTSTAIPSVESDPDILTKYTGIDLLPVWPKAKFTQYFRGELWVANLEDSPYQVRWSAPQPVHHAWPILNTEFLIENDKSPITGLYGFGQNMVIFKNDSIYEMIDTGVSTEKLQTYAPERRVAGKGAVSHHTIQNVNGRLVFLAEDGVYAYDGSPSVANLGMDQETNVDRIKHIIRRITPGARSHAVGVNWSTRHCYLLAIPLDGADDNTHVLCFDYENNAWWLWDIAVRIWLLDEGPDDNQTLYFADKNGMVYQFDRGVTDHGGEIDAYVVTRQMVTSTSTLRAREVEIISTNSSRELEVSITAEDEPVDQATPATLNYTDEVEKDYNVATYNVDKYTLQRDRKKAVGVRLDGNSFRVKVAHDDKYSSFVIKKISVGYIPVGKR